MVINLISDDLNNNVRNKLIISDLEEITDDIILKIKSLNIKRIGYGLKENKFIPKELEYFKNLETCEFSGMVITDEIIDALNKLENLKTINFDFCQKETKKTLYRNIQNIYMNNSNYGFIDIFENKMNIQTIRIKDSVDDVDIEKIVVATNLSNLNINNSVINNCFLLTRFSNLERINFDGSQLDSSLENLNLSNVNISQDENFYFRG